MPSLSVRLAERRIKQGMTKAAAAAALQVSVTTLRSWEGGGKPQEHHIHRVAAFLGEEELALHKEVFGG